MSVGIRYESHDFHGETFKGVKQRNSMVLSFKEIFLVAHVGSPGGSVASSTEKASTMWGAKGLTYGSCGGNSSSSVSQGPGVRSLQEVVRKDRWG